MRRALLLCGLTLAGCGGGGDERAATPTASPTTTSDPATAAAVADTAFVRDATLEEKDFAGGWTGSVDELTSTCSGIEDTKSVATAPAEVATFVDERSGSVVINSVIAFPDEDTAFRGFSALRGAGTEYCLAEEVAESVNPQEDKPWEDLDSEPLAVPSVGDEADAQRMLIPVSVDGTDVEYSVDLVVVLEGRSVSLLGFSAVDEPFPRRLREQLTAVSAEKMARNIT